MPRNWKKDIRSTRNLSRSASNSLCRTPPLLKSLNKRSRKLKQKQFYQNSQLEWIAYYHKLTDEYCKIEAEINTLDFDYILHCEIKEYREDYANWLQSITNNLTNFYSNETKEYQTLQQLKHLLDKNTEQMTNEQQSLEKELKQFNKSIHALNNDVVSMRKENVKYHEFCGENNIYSTDIYGGWTQTKHLKFVALYNQYKISSFHMFYAQIKVHFSDATKADMRSHYEWYRLYLQHLATNKRMKSESRSKYKLITKQKQHNASIRNSLQRIKLKEKIEKETFKSKLSDLHHKMNDIQHIRKDQQQHQQMLEAQQKEEAKQKMMQENIEWNEHRNEQKDRLNEYYKEKIMNLEIMEQKAKKLEQEKKKTQKVLNEVNRQRIEYRENKRCKKIETQKELELRKEEEVSMKEERLMKLRMIVQKQLNHENIDNISGVLRHTESAINRINNDANKIYNEGVVDLFPNKTYSDETLFNDPKFALMNHLISNNLHTNNYAKQCIINTQSMNQPRKDCSHSDIF